MDNDTTNTSASTLAQPTLSNSTPFTSDASNNQTQLQHTTQVGSRKFPLLLAVVIILILAVIGGGYSFFKKTEQKQLTIAEGLAFAKNIDPYLPEGFSIAHKAELVELPGGGMLFDTKLVNGSNTIGIVMTPPKPVDCQTTTVQIDTKTVCTTIAGDSKQFSWSDSNATYHVVSSSPDVSTQELEKIVSSL